MTQLVFVLVVSMGAQTISVEHWSGLETCLWYSKRLNAQHTSHLNHTHGPADKTIHAQCMPVRVNPELVQIFDR